jgi:hypothetical protein
MPPAPQQPPISDFSDRCIHRLACHMLSVHFIQAWIDLNILAD